MIETYTARFNMVMQPQERAMLQALADDQGLKESDVVRLMIRAAYKERFGDEKPGKPVPKYNAKAALGAKAKRAAKKK